MKPGPEHVGMRFRNTELDGIPDKVVLVAIEPDGIARLRSAEGTDEYVVYADDMEGSCEPMDAPAGTPLDAGPMLARLLSAGFDHVEIALRATAADPRPSLVFIGYYKNERISWIQVAREADDLPRIEKAALEKLEAIKSAEACE